MMYIKYRLRQAQTDILVLKIYYKDSGCYAFAKARQKQLIIFKITINKHKIAF
jgi:hypothetical protein